MMCIFHKWDKWEQYDKGIPSMKITIGSLWLTTRARTDHFQKRTCKKCGKLQQEETGYTAHE